jgi:hypothetical protein
MLRLALPRNVRKTHYARRADFAGAKRIHNSNWHRSLAHSTPRYVLSKSRPGCAAFCFAKGVSQFNIFYILARAIENQCFVIAAAQFGEHNHKRESYGHALIVDPWGEVLADAGGADGGGTVSIDASNLVTPSIMVQEIDLDLVTSARQRIPIQNHRRAAEF